MKLSAVISLTLLTAVTAKDKCNNGEYYRCDNRQCVSMWHMCRYGYAACNDKSDLKECTEDIQCSDTRDGHTKLPLKSPHAHTECLYKIHENNGVYENIGRGDEKTLPTLGQSSHVNYEELQHCITNYGNPGLKCAEKCITNYDWCRGYNVTFSPETLHRKLFHQKLL